MPANVLAEPAVGDRLAAALDVPIGFVNVAVGNTSTRKWAPDGPLSARLQAIRAAAVEAWGFEPVWPCAFSTHHPTVYQKPEGEDRIREAISRLGQLPGLGLGPDTDTLQGSNRGGPTSRRHFSPQWQRNAAKLWSDLLLQRF